VGLNADLIPAWEHLMMVALLGGDTAAASRALGSLDRLDAGPKLSADGYGSRMLQFRFLHAIQRGDSATVRVLTDSMARDTVGSFYDPFVYGFFPEQIGVSRAALAAGGSPERRRRHRELLALSWVGRGAWDSALVEFDRLAGAGDEPVAPLRAYGLAALGVWLGAVEPAEALARRSLALQVARASGASGRAEIAWLDGVLAASRKDGRTLAEARDSLRSSGDSAWSALDRSLSALGAALEGDTRKAGEAMAALEWEQAAVLAGDFAHHPFAISLNRLAAARWLASNDDPGQAQRLLRWVDGGYALHPSTLYTVAIAGLADLERGRVEEQLGRPELARSYYQRFLRRYDRPVPQHVHLVKEARARLVARDSP
jgi:tetratricopeptide (TPR) repeat protein